MAMGDAFISGVGLSQVGVRFLLTRQGLELMGVLEPAAAPRPRYLN